MTKYQHLLLEERVELYSQLKLGVSLRVIAKTLGRNHTSLSRELKRHTKYCRPYKPVLANSRADRWAARQRYQAPLKNPETLNYVLSKLRLGWSPETIAGRMKLDKPNLTVSYESIYRWIYSKFWKRHQLWQYLESGHIKRRKKQGRSVASKSKVLNARSIDLRPVEINLRQSVGHWETDLMESSRADPAALSVTVERLTRFVRLKKVSDKTSGNKTQALTKQKIGLPDILWVSVTTDRGRENFGHKIWEDKLGVVVYFCNPYHSWEKGTVENTIKRIRRFIPKGENLSDYSWQYIQKVEGAINNKPMKCLQYLTPYERMAQSRQDLEVEGV
ncbi:MAG: IS30 family transposase [Patescibacteria group bacterium]